MKNEKQTAYLACLLLLRRENKVLLLRRFNTGYMDGNYTMPSGHLDGIETAKKAVKREAREEIGIKVNLKDLKLVHMMHRRKEDKTGIYVDFFFTAERFKGKPRIVETDKCDDVRWFDINHLPKNTIPFIVAAIKRIRKGEPHSEFGF